MIIFVGLISLYSYLNDHGGTDPNTAIGDQGSLQRCIFPYLKTKSYSQAPHFLLLKSATQDQQLPI